MIEMFTKAYQIFTTYYPSFLLGVQFTLIISITGTLIGLVLGLFVGGIRAIKVENSDPLYLRILKKVIYFITSIYVEVFRGTPMMVQAVFIYYAVKPIYAWTPVVAGIFIISVNTGAYMSEIIRSGIQSVDKGQSEAARSLGMSSMQTMLCVILPQAIKNAFPSIGNEFIVNIKDSSVLNVISVTELFFQSNSIAGSIFRYKETFLVTACVYLVLTFTTSRILALIEKRMNHTSSSFPTSQTVPSVVNLQTRGE